MNMNDKTKLLFLIEKLYHENPKFRKMHDTLMTKIQKLLEGDKNA